MKHVGLFGVLIAVALSPIVELVDLLLASSSGVLANSYGSSLQASDTSDQVVCKQQTG